MKRLMHVVLGFSLLAAGCSGQLTPVAPLPSEEKVTHDISEVPAPVSFVPPEVDEFSLSNGIKVYFIRDDELPVIRGMLYLQGGALLEDKYPAGSFAALGSLMREGGAGNYTADELDQSLEKLSANISTGFSGEHGTFSFVCLSQDIEQVMSLYTDVLFKPRLQEDRLSLWKGQIRESIRRRKDAPDSVAAVAFNQLLFGDTPAGRPLMTSDLGILNQELLRSLHGEFIRPDGAVMAVSGAISREALRDLLERHLGSWLPRGVSLEVPLMQIPLPQAGVYFIEMPFTQATIYVGQQGPVRLDPQYAELEGFNTLFGADGQFSSLLTKEVRSDRGLAYSVIGGVFQGYPLGKELIALQTKSESTGEALNASLGVLKQIQEGAFTEADVADVKRSISNSYVFKFSTTDSVVQRRALLSLLKYPETYDDTYTERINRLTPDAISRIARERWNPGSYVILVLGNRSAFESLQNGIASGPEFLKALPLHEIRFDESIVK